jgi:uncharacterized ion transporter superfamily protein YfcC
MSLSFLSFWGLVFSLIAVTLFVLVYTYKNLIEVRNNDTLSDLRRCSVAVYLAAESSASEDISKKLRAANEIEWLRSQNSILFWLIIAMNTVVAGILSLGYAIF